MADCFVYDAVRTPRGRGKPGGSLHEVAPVNLAVTVLQALRDRNGLDTAMVDDVVLGCVEPVGDQGADIARTLKQFRAQHPEQQLLSPRQDAERLFRRERDVQEEADACLGEPLAQQRRQLIAQRLAAAGRHQHQRIATIGDMPHDRFLLAAERRQPERLAV